MKHDHLLLILIFCGLCWDCKSFPDTIDNGNITHAQLNYTYKGVVSNGAQNVYSFELNGKVPSDGTVRISISSTDATESAPLSFVARLIRGVISWNVPFTSDEGIKYNHVSQTLCPYLNNGSTKESRFFVDVSTLSSIGLSYNLIAKIDDNFVLRSRKSIMIKTNPAEPVVFTYTFSASDERVLVKAESESNICATLLVQNSKCPLLGQSHGEYSGVYATMTTKAGITVEKNRIPGLNFFIVVIVRDTDTDCTVKKGSINPFAPVISVADWKDFNQGNVLIKNGRSKNVTITIVPQPRIEDYLWPVAAPGIYFGMFYFIAFIILGISWCMAEDGGKPFLTYLFPKKVKANVEGANNGDPEVKEQDQLMHHPLSDTYGSIDSAVENPGLSDHISSSPNPSIGSESDYMDGYDWLEDIDKHKDIYRLKKKLYVSDLSKKPYKKLAKKFNIYYWNLLTVCVFYALPVIQLVLTYQRVVNTSGNQDICYYNFYCARPYHLLSAFNNVYSNIGYMMLGLLFVFLVMRRDRLAKQVLVKDKERAERYGIPKHYGILYAMGYALFMEGVMSACYHVCPNYSNFQFDTAFMYMIGILACLRIYQTRHHDVFLNGHFAFAGLAAVIFTSVIGVIFRSWQFWLIFLILHVITCFYVSCQIYFMGRIKTAFALHWYAGGHRFRCCGKPVYMMRFFLMLAFNIMNWALSINGLVNIPRDFATYLLGIIICNGIFYIGFYVIMKLRNGEKIQLLPMIMVVLSLISWGISITFFVKGLTDWQLSPAQSREGNKTCELLNFYDYHDLWHFLSAMGMFFSFMALLTLDDDLDFRDRSTIAVF